MSGDDGFGGESVIQAQITTLQRRVDALEAQQTTTPPPDRAPVTEAPQTGAIINFKMMEREDGGLRVWSDDIKGLILSGPEPIGVCAKIWPAIKALAALAAREAQKGKGNE